MDPPWPDRPSAGSMTHMDHATRPATDQQAAARAAAKEWMINNLELPPGEMIREVRARFPDTDWSERSIRVSRLRWGATPTPTARPSELLPWRLAPGDYGLYHIHRLTLSLRRLAELGEIPGAEYIQEFRPLSAPVRREAEAWMATLRRAQRVVDYQPGHAWLRPARYAIGGALIDDHYFRVPGLGATAGGNSSGISRARPEPVGRPRGERGHTVTAKLIALPSRSGASSESVSATRG